MTEHLLKILIVGDGNVGKSSFVNRYISGNFNRTYKMTVGGTFISSRTIHMCSCYFILVFTREEALLPGQIVRIINPLCNLP